ncbi:unnamed protein product [Dovyalis caffra]|uniref:Nodulin-like domain-containing protein n=1 Tax=Dovyalis caffra TaxID=77055 RepID=A0AAV1RYC4_9ROSI|nr:unnamed protein product [Dovyalis caffra]
MEVAGCSISWFNTVSYVLCIRNFPTNRSLALSLTVSFNGVGAALYTLMANATNPADDTPLLPIHRQTPLLKLSTGVNRRDIFAVVTGLYLLMNSQSSIVSRARILLGGSILQRVLPLCLPGIVSAKDWATQTIQTSFSLDQSGFNLADTDDLDLFKELIEGENGTSLGGNAYVVEEKEGSLSCFQKIGSFTNLGEEHPARLNLSRWDFWLYYIAYSVGVWQLIGFLFSAAVSITSELFGPNSAGATVYDSNARRSHLLETFGDAIVCMGRQCYLKTFISWGCISLKSIKSLQIVMGFVPRVSISMVKHLALLALRICRSILAGIT